jgi:hypothetical protein
MGTSTKKLSVFVAISNWWCRKWLLPSSSTTALPVANPTQEIKPSREAARISTLINLEIVGYIITALVAFMMCAQAKKHWLNFIPGTFIGSCATFAAAGNWQLVIPSLIVGVIFGYLMKTTGIWLHAKLSPNYGQINN